MSAGKLTVVTEDAAGKPVSEVEWVTLEAYAISEGLSIDDIGMRTLEMPQEAMDRYLLPGTTSVATFYNAAVLKEWLDKSFAAEAAVRLGSLDVAQNPPYFDDDDGWDLDDDD